MYITYSIFQNSLKPLFCIAFVVPMLLLRYVRRFHISCWPQH